jgi:transposase
LSSEGEPAIGPAAATPEAIATVLAIALMSSRTDDQATKDYIARRVAEGKTTRDAVRLLKRYLARHLYRVMQNTTPLTI